MKSADAAGLMTAGAGHVVEPSLEAGDRADVFECDAARRGFLQCRDDLALAKNLVAVTVGLHEAESKTPFDEADFSNDTKEADDTKPRKRKPDPADWWKRGEAPPF